MVKLRLLPAPPLSPEKTGELSTCAYTPDDARILSGGWDGKLRVWSAETGLEIESLQASDKPIIACAVSPDGRFYLSACLNGFLAHWEAKTRVKAAFFLAHWRPVSCIAFSPGGLTLATASWDMNLILWELNAERDWRSLTGHQDIVSGCRFTPKGEQILSWSHDGTLKLWHVGEATLLREFQGHRDRVTAADISQQGQWAASGSRDRTLRLWDLAQTQEIASVALASEIRGCFFLPGGKTLLAITDDGSLSTHHLPGLEQEGELLTDLSVLQGALATDGRQLALACADGRIHRATLEGVEAPVSSEKKTGLSAPLGGFGKSMSKLLHFSFAGASE